MKTTADIDRSGNLVVIENSKEIKYSFGIIATIEKYKILKCYKNIFNIFKVEVGSYALITQKAMLELYNHSVLNGIPINFPFNDGEAKYFIFNYETKKIYSGQDLIDIYDSLLLYKKLAR